MSDVYISGIGIISPFGGDLAETWEKVNTQERPPISHLTTGLSSRLFPYHAVPAASIRTYERHPRLRRSSEISHFAAIAGMNALAEAGLTDAAEEKKRTGIVFAISSGGVRYTTRFYHEIITAGAAAASPLLFPETVYNAPASHLAALLGVDGLSYTLVGDSAIGLSALGFAQDLILTGQLDHCIVVATEEAEWILCEAFRRTRFFTNTGETRPFGGVGNRGTVFSEGAAAVVLTNMDGGEKNITLKKLHRGLPFFERSKAFGVLQTVLQDLEITPDVVFSGANGTRLDDAEKLALDVVWPGRPVLTPKTSLGESVGAGTLQQIALAAHALKNGHFPGFPAAPKTAAITAIGYNALASAAVLSV